ncbi:MAG: hypothetical protein KC592_05470, partial [Nitrospira sp.]|nr:hypothetical protein [Nitrospira sp.]
MLNPAVYDIDQQLNETLQSLDVEETTGHYWDQGEFVVLEHLIPTQLVQEFMREVERVRPQINRNFIPGHKKGGSVSFYLLQQSAPAILAFYRHQGWINLLSQIAGVP